MTWSKRTSRSAYEIRRQRVSHTILPLEADRLPSTVGHMSDSSFTVLLQHYMIHILWKSREIATVINDASVTSFRHHTWPPTHSPPPWVAIQYSLTSVIGLCVITDLWHLIFTFWWSNPNILIILGYEWYTKLIFLPNVLPVYSKMALKCSYFAFITHMMTWPWGIATCWN